MQMIPAIRNPETKIFTRGSLTVKWPGFAVVRDDCREDALEALRAGFPEPGSLILIATL